MGYEKLAASPSTLARASGPLTGGCDIGQLSAQWDPTLRNRISPRRPPLAEGLSRKEKRRPRAPRLQSEILHVVAPTAAKQAETGESRAEDRQAGRLGNWCVDRDEPGVG